MAQRVQVVLGACPSCHASPDETCIGRTDCRARKRSVVVVLLCDLCYDETSARAEPMLFGWFGQGYELDLCQLHWERCADDLAPMIGAARRSGRTGRATVASGRRKRTDPGAGERTCPTCKALPGQRCVRAGGSETGEPHAARRQAPAPLAGQLKIEG